MTDMRVLLQEMLSNYQGADIAGYLADELEKIRYTRDTIAQIKKQISDHERTCKDAIAQLHNQIKNIQMKCQHWTISRHGGTMGFDECDQCGMTWDLKTGVAYDG